MSDVDRFAEFRAAYPKREGGQRWPAAKACANKLIRTGEADWDLLISSAAKYAAFCRMKGTVGGPYVLQAATFLGSAGGWMEDWEPPKPEGPVQLSEEQKREATITRQAIMEGLAREPGESLDSFSDRVRRAYTARIAPPAAPSRQSAAPMPVSQLLQSVKT